MVGRLPPNKPLQLTPDSWAVPGLVVSRINQGRLTGLRRRCRGQLSGKPLGGSEIVLVSREEAQSLVESMIAEADLPEGDVAQIVENATIEKDWGWVFFYESRRFLETGDHASRLAGNSPIIVNARTGVAAHTGTAYPVEHYVTQYERTHGLK